MPQVEEPLRRSRFTDHHIRVHRDFSSEMPWNPHQHIRSLGEHSQSRKMVRLWIAIIVTLLAATAGTFFAFGRYRTFQLGSQVRESFAAGRYETARPQLERWLKEQPGSGEAQYYKAWDALAQNKPKEAVEAHRSSSENGL